MFRPYSLRISDGGSLEEIGLERVQKITTNSKKEPSYRFLQKGEQKKIPIPRANLTRIHPASDHDICIIITKKIKIKIRITK